ncbi:MAG: hypothetical protein ACKVT0_03155 [Planctomycetaceae bacterium]
MSLQFQDYLVPKLRLGTQVPEALLRRLLIKAPLTLLLSCIHSLQKDRFACLSCSSKARIRANAYGIRFPSWGRSSSVDTRKPI